MELKDWLNSINQTKKNLIDEDPSLEKEYPPYIVNRCLSGHLDCIIFANEMNKYNFLPKKLQYEFLLNRTIECWEIMDRRHSIVHTCVLRLRAKAVSYTHLTLPTILRV